MVGITFVCVTHHQQEALAMSDRVGVMQQGRLVQVGTPREVYEKPAGLAVVRFIGESNELQGELREAGDGYGVMTASLPHGSRFRVRCPDGLVSSRKVVLSLRPEQVHLSSEAALPNCDNFVPGHIEKCLYGGQTMQYVVRVAEELRWKIMIPPSRCEDKMFAPGERVCLGWHADDGMIFPA
jgi:spermidine/putrescine transport system ATP-binding protein